MHTLIIEGTFKPGKKTEFVTAWKKEILPTLKKQPGFVDEILLFGTAEPDSGVGLSFWKSSGEAEIWKVSAASTLTGSVKHLMNGSPTVRSFNVEAAETFHIAAGKAA